MKKSILMFLCLGAIVFSANAGQPPDVNKKALADEVAAFTPGNMSDVIVCANCEDMEIAVEVINPLQVNFIYFENVAVLMKPATVSINLPPESRRPIFNLPFYRVIPPTKNKFLIRSLHWRCEKL